MKNAGDLMGFNRYKIWINKSWDIHDLRIVHVSCGIRYEIGRFWHCGLPDEEFGGYHC